MLRGLRSGWDQVGVRFGSDWDQVGGRLGSGWGQVGDCLRFQEVRFLNGSWL